MNLHLQYGKTSLILRKLEHSTFIAVEKSQTTGEQSAVSPQLQASVKMQTANLL